MRAPRDPDRLIHDFVLEGAERLHDRVYDAVRATIEQKRQRVVFGPWRTPIMNKLVPIGLGAAAVVVALVAGAQLLGPPGPSGPGGAPSVTPSPTAEPSVAASLVPIPVGQLEPGTYAVSNVDPPIRTLVRYTFEVPAGWAARLGDLQISKGGDTAGEVHFTPFVVTHVYTDACDSEGTLTEIGPTVADLVAALVDQVSSEATAPVDVEVGGYPAKFITMSVPADLDTSTCRHPELLIQIWANAAENDYFAIPVDPAVDPYGGVYIVDVDGDRVVMVTGSGSEASAADIAELEAIIASIRFQP
jgi:hypothetical protein